MFSNYNDTFHQCNNICVNVTNIMMAIHYTIVKSENKENKVGF